MKDPRKCSRTAFAARRAGVVVAVIAGTLSLVAGAASAAGATLYVSTSGTDTNNNCRSNLNPCRTITHALSQAPSGSTVKVQSGTYDEQVKITKPVTIVGAGPTSTVIEPSAVPQHDTDTDSTQPQFYVVDAMSSGVNLKGIGVNGTAATPSLDANGLGCGQDYVGVYYHDATGTMNNDSVTGIEMPADLFGCQGGLAVYAATDHGATASNLTMTADKVNTYDKNGITCDDTGTSCTITGTTVSGIGATNQIAQNGIQIWGAAAKLSNDTVSGNTYSGGSTSASGLLIVNPQTLNVSNNTVTSNDVNVYVAQDTDPSQQACGQTTGCPAGTIPSGPFTIKANTASNATNASGSPSGSGVGDGIDLDSVQTPTSVLGNQVKNDPEWGIALLGTVQATVLNNTAALDGDGLYLGTGFFTPAQAEGDVVRSNKVSSSSNDGILADAGTFSNSINSNTMHQDAVFDAQDKSTGGGTAGTANLWTRNNCTSSSPPGLCGRTGAATSSPASGVARVERPRAAKASPIR